MSPAEVIREIKTARLRGRGGAGFPTGMKWEFTRAAGGDERYLICNADEGEPGTFKDRVILTERPDLLFEGMTVAGYAIGARQGILYLRAEYAYLRALPRGRARGAPRRRPAGQRRPRQGGLRLRHPHPDGRRRLHLRRGDGADQLAARAGAATRDPAAVPGAAGLPGQADLGQQRRDAVLRGPHPRDGLGLVLVDRHAGAAPAPSCSVISGDCRRPGVYEVPFGISLREVLELCGADEPLAVQVGGPSGQMVGAEAFDRTICFDDLATGGALMVFGPGRNLLEIAAEFMRFFVHESCGYCTPCRVGNVLLLERLDKILAGHGEAADLDYLEELGAHGQDHQPLRPRPDARRNPVLSTLENFRARVREAARSSRPTGSWPASTSTRRSAPAKALTGRRIGPLRASKGSGT